MPVKGASKSIIADIQRNTYKSIPNSLYEILKENEIINFDNLSVLFNNTKIINEYKLFLLNNEFIFECEEAESQNFPKIETNFFKPYQITNSIIEVSKKTNFDIKNLKKSFDELGIQDTFVLFYEENLNFLNDFLLEFNDSRLLSIQILFPSKDKSSVKKIISKYARVTKVIFYNSSIDKIVEDLPVIIYSTKNINSFLFCGEIKNYFVANIDSYLESLNHNSCLHKKISIDQEGYIRNCPSMPQHFGNIKDTTLEEALAHPDFKKYWNITKDMIQVCKDCEFRHICTDCRAYTERSHFEGDIDLSKPLKCGYNPYTNEWAEWSTNPLKQKAIEYYGMQELVKKDA